MSADSPIPFPHSPRPSPEGSEDRVASEAAAWVARRDRGLTAGEAAELAAWEAADPRHAAELRHFAASWRDLGDVSAVASLAAEARALDAATAARLRRWRLRCWVGGLGAAAAAVAFGYFWLPRADARREGGALASGSAATAGTFLEVPGTSRRLTLPDGTRVDLNGSSRIEPEFSPARRRVRLLEGEAHFAVVKDPARPFVVAVDGIEVLAVGTAFNVRHAPGGIEVLVTEGRVSVEGAVGGEILPPSPVEAGQRARVARLARPAPELPAPAPAVSVTPVSLAEMSDSLAWQGTRLVFDRLPLEQVIMAFNRHHPEQPLRLSDPRLRTRRISGIFRADNLDGFVRLLGEAFDIAAERKEDGEVLLRAAR